MSFILIRLVKVECFLMLFHGFCTSFLPRKNFFLVDKKLEE